MVFFINIESITRITRSHWKLDIIMNRGLEKAMFYIYTFMKSRGLIIIMIQQPLSEN